ncbi:MAG: hypothetical protein JSV63_00285 [Candidatus Aenigmatarchaeota archaeon]|nr:MAG: hypothetical protein JSV63_00285 [Candidatus Aenigmarchaeota archaeon]
MSNVLVFVLGILFVLLISGCTQTGQVVDVDPGTGDAVAKECPESCDDGNECTADLCDEKSDFECRNVPRWGVECGENGFCQDGICMEKTDNCSVLTEPKEMESCYEKEYIGPAVISRNELECDGITTPEYKSRCYASVAAATDDPSVCEGLEKVPSRDACDFQYAESKAQEYIFASDACESIENDDMRDECMEFEAFVTAPAAMFVQVRGDTQVNTYVVIVLLDRKGRSTTAEGNLTVSLIQEGEEDVGEDIELITLYSEMMEVEESDFRVDTIEFGLVDQGIFLTILAGDLQTPAVRNDARLYVTFATKDGKYVSKRQDFSWDTGLG